MAEAVLVAGAGGYLGSAVVAALRARGREVVALVRSARRAAARPALAGVKLREGDLLRPATLAGAAEGVESVIHLVGILRERGAQTFQALVVEGTEALLAEAQRAGARRFLYVSALGADPADAVAYFRTKGRAEDLVRASGLEWLVLRFAIVLGRGGEFLEILRRLAASPLVPLPGGGRVPLQPIHLADAAEMMARAGERSALWGRTWCACGPRPLELRELVRRVAGGPRLYLPVPWALARGGAAVLRLLPAPPVTPDELAMLARGSVCDPGPAATAFGIALRGVEELLAGTEPGAPRPAGAPA